MHTGAAAAAAVAPCSRRGRECGAQTVKGGGRIGPEEFDVDSRAASEDDEGLAIINDPIAALSTAFLPAPA